MSSPSPSHSSPSDDEEAPPTTTPFTIHHHNTPITLHLPTTTPTLQDLSDLIAEDLHVPPSNQKLLITPKTGLLKPPFPNPLLPLSTLSTKKFVLLGATTQELTELESDIADRKARLSRRREAQRQGRKVKAYTHRDSKKAQDEAQYTFHVLRPLDYLPRPEKSLRFLERLRDDAGIKASMRKHGFSVGLLTEMNPVEHTTRESRTLGLNRNRGEVIELRLRTDAYDGYRDYKTIRKTLCHELAHNVWGEHDSNFWALCKEIEGEVERGDWRRGGRSVGEEEFYNPGDQGVGDEELEDDEGGWEGGEYVLGGGEQVGGGVSRREIMARAAEERMRKQKEARAAEQRLKDSNAPPDAS